MTKPLVLLATCADYAQLIADDLLLLEALVRRGIDARPAVWDAWAERWDLADLVLLRTVWDYHLRCDEFLAWIERVEGQAEILNPPDVVRWNAHKTYLRDLAEQGIPTVPTLWLEAGQSYDLAGLVTQNGWGDVLLKPVVSAAAYETHRVSLDDLSEDQAHLDRLLQSTAMMLQPYLADVEQQGEISLLYFESEYSHAVRRPSALVHGLDLADEGMAVQASPAQRHLADQILATLAETPLYARVDLAETQDHGLLLLEIELIEPSLFFHHDPASADRFAKAIARRLKG